MTGAAWLVVLLILAGGVAYIVAVVVDHATDAERWGYTLSKYDEGDVIGHVEIWLEGVDDGPYDWEMEDARRIAPAVIVKRR